MSAATPAPGSDVRSVTLRPGAAPRRARRAGPVMSTSPMESRRTHRSSRASGGSGCMRLNGTRPSSNGGRRFAKRFTGSDSVERDAPGIHAAGRTSSRQDVHRRSQPLPHRVLGINAAFHDPSAALLCAGRVVAAAEEERFSRRKHGKVPVPFSAWELPEQSAAWCLERAGLEAGDLDAVAYSYDPALAPPVNGDVTADRWEALRTLFVQRAPLFLRTALGTDPERVRFVPHHVAHAASACLAAGWEESSVMVIDGRGERAGYLDGRYRNGHLEVLRTQELPHSLGLLYEELTAHLGFRRSSDEYKVMAMASYGEPSFLDELRDVVRTRPDGGFTVGDVDFSSYAPPLAPGAEFTPRHAALACSVQRRLEEVLLELAGWLHERTGDRDLVLAGGVALNCVANSRLWRDGPFERIWAQPASGDAGTALGAALHVAAELGDAPAPMESAALGRGWDDIALARELRRAGIAFETPADIADTVAEALAADQVVAWFQGRSEYGPRALGHRSLLGDARSRTNLEKLNDIKGREQ